MPDPDTAASHLVCAELAQDDLEAVRDIYNHYVANTTATFFEEALTPTGLEEMVRFTDPRYRTFVLRDGGVTCGFGFLGPYKGRCAYRVTAEVTIYLAPERTGGGLGDRLHERIEQHARAHDLHTLIATVCAENGGSCRFFERQGYRKVAHFQEVGLKFGRLLDVVCYQKILT